MSHLENHPKRLNKVNGKLLVTIARELVATLRFDCGYFCETGSILKIRKFSP